MREEDSEESSTPPPVPTTPNSISYLFCGSPYIPVLSPVTYIRKLLSPPAGFFPEYQWEPLPHIFISIIASFFGILSVALLHAVFRTWLQSYIAFNIVGSLGATAVILYVFPTGRPARPAVVFWAHCLSSTCGVLLGKFCPYLFEGFREALSVSLSIAIMQCTCTLHPPGAATAAIAVTSPLSFYFIPAITLSVMAMVSVAALMLNLLRSIHYAYIPIFPLTQPSPFKRPEAASNHKEDV